MIAMETTLKRPRLCIGSPSNEAEWADAERLVGEHVDWLASALNLSARASQHDSNEELDSLASFYREPAGRFLVGSVNGVASGITGVYMMEPDTAELRRVWVTPAARGHGLAPAMLQAAIDTAKDLGARRIWLETARGHMDTAIAMYTRAGFREIPDYSSLREAVPSLVCLGLELR
jgi:GNAT superfamily N-acetyltransferase